MPDHDFRHLLFLKKSEGRLNSKSLLVEKLTKKKIFFLNRVTAFRGEKCEKGCEGIKKVNRIKRLTQVERMREREREREAGINRVNSGRYQVLGDLQSHSSHHN